MIVFTEPAKHDEDLIILGQTIIAGGQTYREFHEGAYGDVWWRTDDGSMLPVRVWEKAFLMVMGYAPANSAIEDAKEKWGST